MRFASLMALALSAVVVIGAPTPTSTSNGGGLLGHVISALPPVIGSLLGQGGQSVPSSVPGAQSITPSTPYTFTLHLKPADQAGLEARMRSIALENKGEWLTEDQLRHYASPTAADFQRVQQWLQSQGYTDPGKISTSKFGDRIAVESNVTHVQQLFQAQLELLNHLGQAVLQALTYTIPQEIEEIVMLVTPLTQAVAPPKIPGSGDGAAPGSIDPSQFQIPAPDNCTISFFQSPGCILKYYDALPSNATTSNTTSANGKPDLAVALIGDADESYSPADTQQFLATWAPYARSAPEPTFRSIEGFVNTPSNVNSLGYESSMDVQTVVALAYPLQTHLVGYKHGSIADFTGDLYSPIFQHLIDDYTDSTRPRIISLSYAGTENEHTYEEAQDLCQSAHQLVALGTTIVMGSGDTGVTTGDEPICTNGQFVPRWPAGCGAILILGSSTGMEQGEHIVAPADTFGYWSGTGFSNYFPAPSYQAADQAAYVATLDDATRKAFNNSGRAYPDLLAFGLGMPYIRGGQLQYGSGVSLSAPVLASLLAKINADRRAAGKGDIGWPHPLMYGTKPGAGEQREKVFKDFTQGEIKGCKDRDDIGLKLGKGYDAPSGLGRPIYPALRQLFLQ